MKFKDLHVNPISFWERLCFVVFGKKLHMTEGFHRYKTYHWRGKIYVQRYGRWP